eukprot:scaffold1256_cov150-Skeletonema_menzelii.AAC.3
MAQKKRTNDAPTTSTNLTLGNTLIKSVYDRSKQLLCTTSRVSSTPLRFPPSISTKGEGVVVAVGGWVDGASSICIFNAPPPESARAALI